MPSALRWVGLSLLLLLCSCLEPTGPGKKTQLPDENGQDPNLEQNPVEAPDPVDPDDPMLSAFAKVQAVFNHPAYGPCSSCHTRDWPVISPKPAEEAWPLFLTSLKIAGHQVKDVEELMTLVVGCADPQSVEHCAGDPTTTDDDLDTKMPIKYGYDPLTDGHLELLKAWLKEGQAINLKN